MEHCIKLNMNELDIILLALSDMFKDAGNHVDLFVEPDDSQNVEAFDCVMEIGRLMERFNDLYKRAKESERHCVEDEHV